MVRVRLCSGLTRYCSMSTLLTSTGGSSNRVLDGALQASLYSRSAESKVMADAMFIEFSAPPSSRQAPRIRHGAPFNQCSNNEIAITLNDALRHYDQAAIRLASKHRDGALELGEVVDAGGGD